MITIYITGGLGNQIFQIACALGLCYKTNNKLTIGKNLITPNAHQKNNKELTVSTLKQIFPDLLIVDNLDISEYYHYDEPLERAFHYINIYNKLINIDNIDCETLNNKNIILNGYFISEKFFEIPLKCCIEVTPKTMLYKDNTNNFNNMYFIHIRLGDYVNHFLYTIKLINYYKCCINKIKSQDPLAKFIICTNEYSPNLINYINEFPKNAEYIIQEQNNSALDTLYIMKSCKGGICSNSTLSWLGAYFQQFENENENNIKKHNKDYIFMPYPWVNFVIGFTRDNIKDVYPEWTQIYDTINNTFM